MTENPHPELPHESSTETDAPVTRFQSEGRSGLVTGTGLGKYRILERVRSTHNAIIYKARDAMLDRLVTLKQLSPGLIDDPVACGDFKREAQLLARLSGRSRNVTHVYELIGDEHGFFIAEEYIEGDWLEMQISKRIFTAADAPQLLRHGCLALGALQLERIVHRDAWPGNWLVGSNGRLILTNFSTATREGDAVSPSIVHAKYAAPEILLGEPCDCRADIYTFGMLLYETCVGRASLKAWCEGEFGSPKPHEAAWRAWHVDLGKNLPPAHELNSEVVEPLSLLLQEMLRKDIDDRAGSYQQILRTVNQQLAIRRDNTKAIGDEGPKVLEIRRVGNDPSRQASLAWLLRDDQSTTTTRIEADKAAKRSAGRRIHARSPVPVISAESRPRTVVSQHVTQAPPETAARKRLPRTPIVPPAPADVEEPQRSRAGFFLAAALAISVIFTAAFLGYQSYTRITDPGDEYRKTAALVEAAEQARVDGDLDAARRMFRDIVVLTEGDPDLRGLFDAAQSSLLLIEAREAVDADRFADAESALASAQIAGAPPHQILAIRDRLTSRRDALRIREMSEAQIANSQFEQAELSLSDYRKNAEQSGLDPDALDRKLNETREDQEYTAAVEATREAIERKDWETALIKARDAKNIRDIPEARRLVDKIIEGKRQQDHRLRGDQALRDGDFAGAEAAYRAALDVSPDDEIEKNLRTATAARLYVEANEALEAGDLITCQRLLRNSLWQVRSNEARTMLERLTPAFEAAGMVINAERAADAGETEKAIRLLEAAIPNLPSPARERAQATLDRLRR
ncbi:MAG: protein kinase [Phycisphaerales bacterium]|nr:protein kinase [Phycisphaerales bacterium]MCB9854825.1 protein kinase [Phycisphaerales bacterium]MCB9863703.1 protein kinase [Phycisphaerales bacterium]